MAIKISEQIKFPNIEISDKPFVSGFYCAPIDLPTFGETTFSMNRIIKGGLDEFYFPSIYVGLSYNNDMLMKTKAIIDTGAAHCLLQRSVIAQLGLQSFQSSTFRHPQNGVQPTGYYKVNLFVDVDNENGAGLIQDVPVGELQDEEYPADMIIGVSLLKLCTFVYNGKERTFELSLSF